ncbi:uncharacterized protein LOC117103766 isoform X2 [Anneissia japonica]|uniref:uncharacterized protein LOC117103766 isoform X2 n=1 Tax=Anneissia japonica TaxID=1529436 RepID=UPI0014255246|nr:uncharacterized protein LOC117103766 isoform X2 [Anneissia japonica]
MSWWTLNTSSGYYFPFIVVNSLLECAYQREIVRFLLLCGDIEINPGPINTIESNNCSRPSSSSTTQYSLSTAYLCGTCKESVTWEDKGIMCEECETWYHIDCQNINDASYVRLGGSSVVWTCLVCDAPHFSSTLFDLHDVESENRYSVLEDLSLGSQSSLDFGHPTAASSPTKPKPRSVIGPRPLRIVNVNCQSLINKKAPFYNLLDSTKPDIIIATETWFNNSIGDAEYFSSQYSVYRKDRNSTGGGVLVAVNSDFISVREETLEKKTLRSQSGLKSILQDAKLYMLLAIIVLMLKTKSLLMI